MVSKEEVENVAANARINLSEGETSIFSEEFENILGMFETLDEVDTEDVEPSFHPVEVESTTREDEVEDTISKEEAFQNTDNEEEGYFKGPSA